MHNLAIMTAGEKIGVVTPARENLFVGKQLANKKRPGIPGLATTFGVWHALSNEERGPHARPRHDSLPCPTVWHTLGEEHQWSFTIQTCHDFAHPSHVINRFGCGRFLLIGNRCVFGGRYRFRICRWREFAALGIMLLTKGPHSRKSPGALVVGHQLVREHAGPVVSRKWRDGEFVAAVTTTVEP